MRIQHNIPAMSAYRNYTNNTSAVAKNLEKLSSGYKINRAGDDAAGLAVSEKMRAQITGLEVAQKNAKDGISLVQTAEGALTEVHDMLNRMYELAELASNGTYDDEVDRANYQKEIDSLSAEINRIADSVNFNGINLLDGSMAEGSVAASYESVSADDIKKMMLPEAAAGTAAVVGTNTVLETDSDGDGLPSFTVQLDGLSHGLTTTNNDDIALTVGGQALKVSNAVVKFSGNVGDQLSASDIATAYDGATVTLDGISYTATADGSKLVFKADTAPTAAVNAHYDVTFTPTSGGTNPATADVFTTGAVTQTNFTAGTNDVVITVDYVDADGATKQKDVTFSSGGNPNDTTTNLIAAVNADTDLNALFTAGGSNTGVTFTSKQAGATVQVTNVTVKTAGGNVVAVAAGSHTTSGAEETVTGTSGSLNVATVNVVASVPGASDQLANTVLDLSGKMKDGTQIRLGDTTYTFAVGKDSAFKDSDNVIDMTAYTGTETDFEALAASKLTEAAKDNKTFSVSHRTGTAQIGLQQLSDVKDSTDMTTMDKLVSYIGISNIESGTTPKAGKALTLQIGDTADSFNKLSVSINNMHTDAMGIGSINISTQDGASDAMAKIKDAINYVSSTRGDLGATQNRLEHTINNLSVMQENIQDAESTIRDVDIAQEMMAYTKNNILVQSAQAMLAQANQLPQGVLQLLQ